MGEKKQGINTSELFQRMMGAGDQRDILNEPQKKIFGKKQEEKDRLTVYLPKDLHIKLCMEGATKRKGKDKTAIVEAAVELLLNLDDSVFERLKATAEASGRSTGKIVEDALIRFL